MRIAGLLLGDGHPVAVLGGHDARWVSLPAVGGRPAGEVLARERSAWPGPLLAEPRSAADLPAIARHADGVVIGPAELRHPALRQEIARLGRPVVLRRGPGMPLAELLTLADRCAAEGCGGVVLCESRTGGPDLALLREAKERSGRPVLAALGGDAALAGAAVAAGADGLLLDPGADPQTIAEAHEAATLLGALTRREDPGDLAAARRAIDRVDAALATLLERRAALAGTIQRLKPVGGFRGRDPERERQVVAAMAIRAPRLGAARLAPIMNAVIEAGLRLAEEEAGAEPDGGRSARPPRDGEDGPGRGGVASPPHPG